MAELDLQAIGAERERIRATYLTADGERPASTARGLHHFAIVCRDVEETVLGYTQAFSSIGGLLVATANSLAIALAEANRLPAVAMPDFLAGTLGQIDIKSVQWTAH